MEDMSVDSVFVGGLEQIICIERSIFEISAKLAKIETAYSSEKNPDLKLELGKEGDMVSDLLVKLRETLTQVVKLLKSRPCYYAVREEHVQVIADHLDLGKLVKIPFYCTRMGKSRMLEFDVPVAKVPKVEPQEAGGYRVDNLSNELAEQNVVKKEQE